MSVSIRRTDSDRRIGLDERRRGMVAAYVLLGVFAVSGCSLAPHHQTPSLPVSSAYPADTGTLAGASPSSNSFATWRAPSMRPRWPNSSRKSATPWR